MDNIIPISIVVPLYNKEKYIVNTIQSVLNQDYPYFELIIVDDGSSDNSLNIISNIKDNRIRVLSKKNGGVSDARNFGIQSSNYDYIGFLDADDFWDKSYLSEMVQLIKDFPNAKMYGSSYGEIVNNKLLNSYTYSLLPIGYKGYINYIKIFQQRYITPINSSAVIIRKDILKDDLLFSKEIKSGEDLLLWIKIACRHKVAYINKVLSFYNRDVEFSTTSHLCSWDNYFISVINSQIDTKNKEIKLLVDGIIVRMLRPYYAFQLCPKNQELELLNSIDFNSQSIFHKVFYKFLPRTVVSLFYHLLYYIRKYRV